MVRLRPMARRLRAGGRYRLRRDRADALRCGCRAECTAITHIPEASRSRHFHRSRGGRCTPVDLPAPPMAESADTPALITHRLAWSREHDVVAEERRAGH